MTDFNPTDSEPTGFSLADSEPTDSQMIDPPRRAP